MSAEEYRPFFDGVGRGEILFPRCWSCTRFHWYPKPRCPHCGSAEIGWTAVRGAVRLYGCTTVRRAFAAEFEDAIPYTLALVEFADAPGVRLLSRLTGEARRHPVIGMPLRPVFPAGGTDELLEFTAAG